MFALLNTNKIWHKTQRCKKFENRSRFDKVTDREFKGGNFFETQCRNRNQLAYLDMPLPSPAHRF